MKCVYDQDRKALYIIPQTAGDRNVITNVFNMTTAGDFVLIVRQDVPNSDNVISHLEVSRFTYSAPRYFSAWENAYLAAHPGAPEPAGRGGMGQKPSRLSDYLARRAAISAYIATLGATAGDVIVLPNGTTSVDPDSLLPL